MLHLNPLVPARYITVRKAKPDQLSEIEALAAKMEPKLAKAIMELLAKYQEGVDLNAAIAALQANDVGKFIALFTAEMDPAVESAVVHAIQDTVWAAGALTATQAGTFSSVAFQFDRLNPRLITWLQNYSLGLIKQIKSDVREAIRDKLITGMNSGHNPIKTARDIKTVIGLTPKQAKAVENYRKELETFHLKSSAKAYGLGSKIDRQNGRQVFKPDADGTPKDGIDLRRLRDFRYDGKLKSAMTTGKPIPQAQIDKMVEAYARKYRQFRAQTIARTEALRSTNFGVQDAWRQAIDAGAAPEALVRRQWLVAKDERLCAVCAPVPSLNPKKGVPFGQAFHTPKGLHMLPPLHPNCFPAGTLVSTGSGIAGASARWYDGKMAVIRTASGKELTGTVNHPILTDRGWIGIGLIQKGDRVVSRSGAELLAGGKYKENVPSCIEKVARAFLKSGKVATTEVPLSAEDFHGDGMHGEIATVGAYRKLGSRGQPTLFKHRLHGHLQRALQAGGHALARLGGLLQPILAARTPAHCLVCGCNLNFSVSRGHAAPLDDFGFAAVPHLNASVPQDPEEWGAADAVLARQIIGGGTGAVFLDKVESVDVREFSGHVFNLETRSGHYTANGIISHNCRCTVFIRRYEPEQLE